MSCYLRNTVYPPAKGALAAAFVLMLSACGGGGGGGGFVESTPPPPPLPPPAAVTISAPARASVGPGTSPVLASMATPNFTTGPAPGTTFPLLQTTVVLDATSIAPDAAVNAAGGRATVQGGVPTLTIDGMDVKPPPHSYSFLDWTVVGPWSTDIPEAPWDYGGDLSKRGFFVAGYETPANAMPITGTANYSGYASGSMFRPMSSKDALPCSCQEVGVQGDAFFTANFGARTVTGELTNMYRVWWDESPWNHVTFNSTIAGNGFSGTTRVTAAAQLGMGANATGTIEGRFFGPSAQEAGAVWTLFDGTNAAIGTLVGKQP